MYFALAIVAIFTTVIAGCSKGYETKRTAGDLTVTVKADRYPLVKGDNMLAITVSDAAGKAVTDATVNVRYFMPAMAGMAPMEFSATAAAAGGRYTVAANIPMEGGWKVEVSVAQPGKPSATATFNLDAR
jgi:hypothetical protein